MLSASPGTMATGTPSRASRSASSGMISRRGRGPRPQPAAARVRAPCGVWARYSPARSAEAVMSSPSARLRASTTGSTGMAAPWRRTPSMTRATSAGETNGRAAVMHQHDVGAARRARPRPPSPGAATTGDHGAAEPLEPGRGAQLLDPFGGGDHDEPLDLRVQPRAPRPCGAGWAGPRWSSRACLRRPCGGCCPRPR